MSQSFIASKSRPFVFQLLYVLLGTIVMVAAALASRGIQQAYASTWVLVVAFGVGYAGLTLLLKQTQTIASYWSFNKILWLLLGMSAGAAIQIAPQYFAYGQYFIKTTNAIPYEQVTLSGMVVTLFIVGWEELWFRNPILNLASTKRQQLLLCVFTGLLFAGLHLMNPKINLQHEGPELFLAGTMLTMAYFASKSFWLPLGLHYGNNMSSSIIAKSHLSLPALGADNEWMYRIMLLLSAILIMWIYWKNDERSNDEMVPGSAVPKW